ncbi:hypothetical protein NCLIV_015560 [Neospora caninum Liverpool]|uniref:DNA-directed RNA polymerase II subunit RPB3 n=1 Tax=Neospora caninum (strain Liverpool) TaxID=572307 RepID=F0VDH1_NEOCL|nr:hypothetical protein NCLIV_015560 [Neospora caninum Liverpool]CBZ51764.1 hypothetical protein NCLIV_015560 [Neospora caninum Liverpool]CEL65721.1 TPA: DNA-directed RNA polymerase II subunit RPB3 [Neospora caninum Liverpool]|eukprot:XP_003881797.1 hypothetical protein NCLIV_015560 [Neospora caninum Liverpool]
MDSFFSQPVPGPGASQQHDSFSSSHASALGQGNAAGLGASDAAVAGPSGRGRGAQLAGPTHAGPGVEAEDGRGVSKEEAPQGGLSAQFSGKGDYFSSLLSKREGEQAGRFERDTFGAVSGGQAPASASGLLTTAFPGAAFPSGGAFMGLTGTGAVGSMAYEPSIVVKEVSPSKVQFLLENCDVSIANALRRVMIAEVPTLAIDLVTVYENTSVLHDEYISHRLGLLPIDSTRVAEFVNREDCDCADHCPRCSVQYALDVVCQNDSLLVTHRDIVADNAGRGTALAPGGGFLDLSCPMPVPLPREMQQKEMDGIPIVKLRRNQSVNMRMTAIKGMGKLHAKWSPVATASYKFEPEISFEEDQLARAPAEVKRQIAASCPRDVFAFIDDTATGGNGMLRVENKINCIYCDQCKIKAQDLGYRKLVRVEPNERKFYFTVESTGVMPAEQIVEMAFDILLNKVTELDGLVAQASTRATGHLRSSPGAPGLGNAESAGETGGDRAGAAAPGGVVRLDLD